MPTDPSEITTRPPLADITRELVQPPSRVYMGVDDRLYVRSRNSVVGTRLQVAGRLLTADGSIVPFNFEHVPLTNRAASIEAFRLAEGYLLSVVVFSTAASQRRGQTFVEIGLLRGRDVRDSVVDVLARDYIAIEEPLAFPGGPIRSSLEGPGALRSITGTDPAAGAEISETVPSDARWKLLAIRFAFVTDANAANRGVLVELTDGTNTYHHTRQHDVQTASLTTTYNYAVGTFFEATALFLEHHNVLPELLMAAGHVWTTVTGSIQAGDNYGAPQYLVEEWIED